jgi:hypothetical protein
METPLDLDALALVGGRVVFWTGSRTLAPGHDIPHPIGDPDEDEELPGDEDDEEEDDEDDEEPMQLRRPVRRSILHRSTGSDFLL